MIDRLASFAAAAGLGLSVASCGTPLVERPDNPSNSGGADGGTDDAGTIHAPSCAPGGPGMTDCGNGGESCCASPVVQGGTFFRTYTNSGVGPTGEADPATVSGFRLDRYEVTVGRFRQFVAVAPPGWGQSGWLPTEGSGRHTHLNGGEGLSTPGAPESPFELGWEAANDMAVDPTEYLACDADYATWTPEPGANEKLPINCVSWAEAYAFCIWDGGFLPSEAEWEYAAADGSEQREFPWGSTPPGSASQYAVYDCGYPSGSATCSGVSNIAPVGTASLGAGAWGQLDLAGNVNEWTLDIVNEAFVQNPRCAAGQACSLPCVDCLDRRAYDTLPLEVDMGGDFDERTAWLLPPSRHKPDVAAPRDARIGFRCARSP